MYDLCWHDCLHTRAKVFEQTVIVDTLNADENFICHLKFVKQINKMCN